MPRQRKREGKEKKRDYFLLVYSYLLHHIPLAKRIRRRRGGEGKGRGGSLVPALCLPFPSRCQPSRRKKRKGKKKRKKKEEDYDSHRSATFLNILPIFIPSHYLLGYVAGRSQEEEGKGGEEGITLRVLLVLLPSGCLRQRSSAMPSRKKEEKRGKKERKGTVF